MQHKVFQCPGGFLLGKDNLNIPAQGVDRERVQHSNRQTEYAEMFQQKL